MVEPVSTCISGDPMISTLGSKVRRGHGKGLGRERVKRGEKLMRYEMKFLDLHLIARNLNMVKKVE